MADETNNINVSATSSTERVPEQNATNPNTPNGGSTPTLRSYTQDELNNLMAREKGTGERSVLKLLGASTKEEAQTFINEHNELKTKYETVSHELNKLKNQSLLASKGVQADFMDYVMFEVGKLVDQKTDFNAAADKFLTAKPLYKTGTAQPEPKPEPANGGSPSQTQNGGQGLTVSFGAAQGGAPPTKTINEQINENIRNFINRK